MLDLAEIEFFAGIERTPPFAPGGGLSGLFNRNTSLFGGCGFDDFLSYDFESSFRVGM
jgi:hypothetical protein